MTGLLSAFLSGEEFLVPAQYVRDWLSDWQRF